MYCHAKLRYIYVGIFSRNIFKMDAIFLYMYQTFRYDPTIRKMVTGMYDVNVTSDLRDTFVSFATQSLWSFWQFQHLIHSIYKQCIRACANRDLHF